MEKMNDFSRSELLSFGKKLVEQNLRFWSFGVFLKSFVDSCQTLEFCAPGMYIFPRLAKILGPNGLAHFISIRIFKRCFKDNLNFIINSFQIKHCSFKKRPKTAQLGQACTIFGPKNYRRSFQRNQYI